MSIRAGILTTIAVLALVALADPALARSRLHPACNVMMPCIVETNPFERVRSIKVRLHRVRHATRARHAHVRLISSPSNEAAKINTVAQIVSHPNGCPARSFCGCGASVRIFGRSVRELWLAANWFKFPRAEPAPRMVAVRRHHVFVLEQHLGGKTWLVYDANSGRHLTRIHARSIAGYQIVNPRAG